MNTTARFVRALTIAAFVAGFCSNADAQLAGSYVGTSVDNANISLTITGTSPNFTITTTNVSFFANCTHPAGSTTEGWGFFLGQVIVPGENDFHASNHYYDIRGSLHFSGNKTIKGTLTSVTTVFVPGEDPPAAGHFCKSPKQGFTLKFQNTVPKGLVVHPLTDAVAHSRQ